MPRGYRLRWAFIRIPFVKSWIRPSSVEPVLASFRLDAPIYVVTDASPVGIGTILLQDQGDGERKPIAYISRSLVNVNANGGFLKLSAKHLVALDAIERLHNYLFGIQFTLLLINRNKPLSTMMDPHSSKFLPPRITP